MKTTITKTILLLLIFILSIPLLHCTSDKTSNNTNTNPADGTGVSDALHISWNSPTWQYYLNCNELILNNQYQSYTSASTKEVFYYTFPEDSSAIVQPGKIKKYPIQSGDFSFTQSLPLTLGASEKMYAKEGLSNNSFNDLMLVKYTGRINGKPSFLIKAKYAMQMKKVNQTDSDAVTVTGDYSFKVVTTSN